MSDGYTTRRGCGRARASAVAFIPSAALLRYTPSVPTCLSPRMCVPVPRTSRERNRAAAAIAAAAHKAEIASTEALSARLDAQFRALQDEMRGVENVEMFNRDEYEVDERGLLWEMKMRGMSLEEVKERTRARTGKKGVEGEAIAYDDIMEKEVVEGFEDSLRTTEPWGNADWVDPMPESDFDRAGIESEDDEDNYVRFRGDLRQVGEEGDEGMEGAAVAGDWLGGDLEMKDAMLAKVYVSEEEEIEALKVVFEKREWRKFLEGEDNEMAQRDSVVPVAEPEEFRKWQRAAEERGGNASEGDSNFLGPAKLASDQDVAYERRMAGSGNEEGKPPNQFDSFVEVQSGQWEGFFSVHAVDENMTEVEAEDGTGGDAEDGNDSGGSGRGKGGDGEDPTERRDEERGEDAESEDSAGDEPVMRPAVALWTGSVCSVVSTCEGESVNFETRLSLEGEDVANLLSSEAKVAFAPQEEMVGNSLAPGRAVFDDGSYMLQTMLNVCESPELSLSDSVVKSVLSESGRSVDGDGSGELKGVAEVCIMSQDGSTRHRTLLYTQSDVLTYIVSVCETRSDDNATFLPSADHSSLISSLLGRWRGRGMSLHPYFPTMPLSTMTSVHDFEVAPAAPAPQDLTYVKEDLSSSRAALDGLSRSRSASQEAEKQPQKQKLSKRVVQALKRDAARLAACRLSSNETLQDVMTERTAWQMVEGGLYSPRLGPRVPDYFALALPGGAVVLASIGKWKPGVRSRLEVVLPEGSASGAEGDKKRTRMIGARSMEGDFTGIALIRETSTVD